MKQNGDKDTERRKGVEWKSEVYSNLFQSLLSGLLGVASCSRSCSSSCGSSRMLSCCSSHCLGLPWVSSSRLPFSTHH